MPACPGVAGSLVSRHPLSLVYSPAGALGYWLGRNGWLCLSLGIPYLYGLRVGRYAVAPGCAHSLAPRNSSMLAARLLAACVCWRSSGHLVGRSAFNCSICLIQIWTLELICLERLSNVLTRGVCVKCCGDSFVCLCQWRSTPMPLPIGALRAPSSNATG